MPLLSYSSVSDFPFAPFTKIYSADINNMFSLIQTLLNTTLLDYQNVQALGLKRYGSAGNFQAGTPNYVIYNDSSGYLTESATLPTAQGGLGFAPTLGAGTANQTISVNSTGTGFQLSNVTTAASYLVNYFNLG